MFGIGGLDQPPDRDFRFSIGDRDRAFVGFGIDRNRLAVIALDHFTGGIGKLPGEARERIKARRIKIRYLSHLSCWAGAYFGSGRGDALKLRR